MLILPLGNDSIIKYCVPRTPFSPGIELTPLMDLTLGDNSLKNRQIQDIIIAVAEKKGYQYLEDHQNQALRYRLEPHAQAAHDSRSYDYCSSRRHS